MGNSLEGRRSNRSSSLTTVALERHGLYIVEAHHHFVLKRHEIFYLAFMQGIARIAAFSSKPVKELSTDGGWS
jgi:hypothetical protein